ncbi:MAG TPA: hypothetical protein VJ063_18120, partial [Verrucomicrobiae bacterium]|nr:hypothetical protein [Verrucomicrobiae bacterium]
MKGNRISASLAFTIPLLVIALCSSSSAQPAPLVPLFQWYSDSRGDFAVSTIWTNAAIFNFPDYAFVRIEGQIFSPSAPQPPDTVPLWTWFSPSRGEYFATTDSRWVPNGGVRAPDYTFVRTQGFVFN